MSSDIDDINDDDGDSESVTTCEQVVAIWFEYLQEWISHNEQFLEAFINSFGILCPGILKFQQLELTKLVVILTTCHLAGSEDGDI